MQVRVVQLIIVGDFGTAPCPHHGNKGVRPLQKPEELAVLSVSPWLWQHL
jgi:hypothetical protein